NENIKGKPKEVAIKQLSLVPEEYLFFILKHRQAKIVIRRSYTIERQGTAVRSYTTLSKTGIPRTIVIGKARGNEMALLKEFGKSVFHYLDAVFSNLSGELDTLHRKTLVKLADKGISLAFPDSKELFQELFAAYYCNSNSRKMLETE